MSPKTCRRCQQPMTLDTKAGIWACPNGHTVPETLDEAQARMKTRGERPTVAITFRGQLEPRARSLFDAAHAYLWRDDRAAAIRALEQARDLQSDFTDAYLWLAKLSDDPGTQRHNLEEALARDPGNLEALRLMMVLNGELTPEEARRALTEGTPQQRVAEQPVKATAQTLICPVCGGGLTVDEASGRVVCKFCGYLAPLEKQRSDREGSSLGVALLKRRAQAVQWVIGERLLRCQQCGSERTIPANRLSRVCPFCGANAVIESDALKTVEQPDTIIPFVVTEDEAKAAIRDRLKQLDERVAGMIDDNRVAHAVLEGVYLPLWVFDALLNVSQTTIDRRTPNSRDQLRTFQPYQNVNFPDGMVGVPIFGMKQPPILDRIAEYTLSAAQAYEPERLARHPAALYEIDFDAASLIARARITEAVRGRYKRESASVEVTPYVNVTQMTFTLMLAPVWIATLYERDGELRPAVVNGQTGAVALGVARKP